MADSTTSTQTRTLTQIIHTTLKRTAAAGLLLTTLLTPTKTHAQQQTTYEIKTNTPATITLKKGNQTNTKETTGDLPPYTATLSLDTPSNIPKKETPPPIMHISNPYENPTTDGTVKAKYSNNQPAPTSTTLTNLLGRPLTPTLNKQLPPGTHEIHINLGNNPTGIYFLRIQTPDGSTTKRITYINQTGKGPASIKYHTTTPHAFSTKKTTPNTPTTTDSVTVTAIPLNDLLYQAIIDSLITHPSADTVQLYLTLPPLTPTTTTYAITTNINNGPPAPHKQATGKLTFSNKKETPFTTKYGQETYITRTDTIPTIETVLLTITEGDSTTGTQKKFTATHTTNGDTTYMLITDSWKNMPPTQTKNPDNITTKEDSTAKTQNPNELFNDFNQDPLTYTLQGLPPDWTAQYLPKENTFLITPPKNWNGTLENLTITASDGQKSTTSQPFSITATPVNDPPTTTVPGLTLPNRDTRQLNLNKYVTDPDNNPKDMTWQATEYDTTLLDIIIDSLNTATITSKGKTGTTQILWTATDPEGAKGQNQSTTQIKPSHLLTLQTWDPINKGIWPNDTLIVITPYGKKQIITDNNGTATTYVTSDTGRVLVPLNTKHYETQQPYKKPTQDGKLTIPITGIEFPIGDFVTFQGGTKYAQYTYITRWHPRYINKAKNPEDPDTLRYAYIEPDTLESNKKYIGHYQTLKDTIESWNKWLFPRMTGGRLVITPLDMDKNVQFYSPKSRDDEIAKNIELMDTTKTKVLPDSAGAFQLVSYYGMIASSLVQDRPGEPDSSLHYPKRGSSTVAYYNSAGWWLEEIGNTMLAMHGEALGKWRRTAVYGGHAQWPPFVEYWPYRNEEIAGEEIIGNFKFRHPVHTLVRREGIIILPPKTPAYR